MSSEDLMMMYVVIFLLYAVIVAFVFGHHELHRVFDSKWRFLQACMWPFRVIRWALSPIYRLLSLPLIKLFSLIKKWILTPTHEYISYLWMNSEEKEAFRLKLDLARWKKAEKKSEARAKYHEVRRRNEERRNLRAIEQQGRIQKDISATRARINCLDLEIYGGEDAESSKGVAER